MMESLEGNMAGAQEPRCRVNETTADSAIGRTFLKRVAKPLSEEWDAQIAHVRI